MDRNKTIGLGVLLAGVAGLAGAHPHFNKTVSAAAVAPGVDLTVTYNTTPSNEARATAAKVGEFVTPRQPLLKVSAELKNEKVTLPAGEYTIGVIKNSETDWTLALYPGKPERGVPVDLKKVIKLDSVFEKDKGVAEHMLVDITPGHGKFTGKAVLTLHFGSLFVAGALS
jgi:hypothetical protein